MSYTIRPAESADEPHVRSFTQDTFEWGDYVAEAFAGWLADPSVYVAVAIDDGGRAVAVGTARMSSPREVWMASARVHPDHRRQSLGSLLNSAGVEWGRENGARVARLLIEDWNEAPQRQVTGLGYRRTSGWVFARRSDLRSDPNPLRNGGPRVPGPERLLPAARAEVDDAWVAWNSGRLMPRSRGLVSRHWIFWSMSPGDLVEAKHRGDLWSCPSGWVIGSSEDDRFAVTWMQASPDDYRRVIRACVDHAVEAGMGEIAFWLPTDEDLLAALESIGFDLSRSSIWEKSL
jgi:GNAT superfamily N-acetyltransferase